MENRFLKNDAEKPDEKLVTDDNGFIQVYTAGSCLKNGTPGAQAGVGVWFGDEHPLNVSEPIRHRHTSNCAQMEACTRAIQVTHSRGFKKICINTFSEYTIHSVTKKKNLWIKYDGEPVKLNSALVELDSNIKVMDEVKWNKVLRRNGLKEVKAAHDLAHQGALIHKDKEE